MNKRPNRVKQLESYLKASCRVPENKIPFFLHWVLQYHRLCESPTQHEPVRLKAFLIALSRTRAEWQVKQAERAMDR